MSRTKKNKEKERYYLLPGQGGRMYRKKQKTILLWSMVAGFLVCLIVAAVMYFTDRN
jgi:hypothetical protein